MCHTGWRSKTQSPITIQHKIILDNIHSSLSQTEIIKHLTDKHNQITCKPLPRGGIEIHTTDERTKTQLLDNNSYDTDIYGTRLYPHQLNQDQTIPRLCINKIPYTKENEQETLELIRHTLTYTNTTPDKPNHIAGLHRKYKGKLPTTLILFSPQDIETHDTLHNQNTQLDNTHGTHSIRTYINTNILQCTTCHVIGHSHSHCTNSRRCVMCGGNCKNDCPQGTPRKCVNCGGSHPSTHHACPVITSHKHNILRTHKLHTESQQQITSLRTQNTQLTNTVTTMQSTINSLTEKLNIIEQHLITLQKDTDSTNQNTSLAIQQANENTDIIKNLQTQITNTQTHTIENKYNIDQIKHQINTIDTPPAPTPTHGTLDNSTSTTTEDELDMDNYATTTEHDYNSLQTPTETKRPELDGTEPDYDLMCYNTTWSPSKEVYCCSHCRFVNNGYLNMRSHLHLKHQPYANHNATIKKHPREPNKPQ